MTTKLAYLKKCVSGNVGNGLPIENRDWYVLCFTNPMLKKTENWEKGKHLYDIITQEDGLYYIGRNEQDEPMLVRIEDQKKGEPLFSFQDEIEIDNTWLSNVEGKITTKIGRLVVNAMALYGVVGERLPYVNIKMTQGYLESIIVAKVKDTEEMTDTSISVSEMIQCIDRLNFFLSISTFANVGATVKTITPPTGIKEYKEKLLKEYEGRLDDPVIFVEFEKKLKKFDEEYLADDKDAANIIGKKQKTARAKMFLAYGNTMDFQTGDKPNTIVNSLAEGIDSNPEEIAKGMNDLRYGSYSRGSSTALSGYSYKVLQRSLSGLKVNRTPCDTTKGYKRTIHNGNYKKLITRYIKEAGWKLIEDEATAKLYIGKVVEFRSVMYCTAKNNSVCFACLSTAYKDSESGITNLAANISTALMILFLKKMHSVETLVVDVELDDILT